MIRQCVFAVGLMLAVTGIASAETPEDGQACADDALRHCDRVIRDRDRLIACLVYNHQIISASCRNAIASYLPAEAASKEVKEKTAPKSTGAVKGPLNLNPDLR